MNKIESLYILNFRQLKDLRLQNLKPFNLLVGENSSGKTSVLEAISLFCRPLDALELLNVARRREVKSSRERLLDGVRWLFPQHAAAVSDPYFQGNITITGNGLHHTKVSIEFQGLIGDASKQSLFSDDEDPDTVENSPTTTVSPEVYETRRGAEIRMSCTTLQRLLTGELEVKTANFELWEDERYVNRGIGDSSAIPVVTLSPVAHRVELLQSRQLSEATLRGDKFSVVQAIQLIDPQIDGLEVVSRSGMASAVWVHHATAGFSPISNLGDGTRRVLSIALALQSVKGGVLLIDEVETAIHKDAFSKFFSWLLQAGEFFRVQIFATTHSLEAIDAILSVSLKQPDQLVAFQLPDRDSKTKEVKRFSGDILESLRFDQGIDVR
jgi:ABC-type branched-subunit amino acid transport system ATPase component